MKLPLWLLRFLKVRYWGVVPESYLPPEFVITKHAYDRIDQRIYASNALTHEQWAIFAWLDGKSVSPVDAKTDPSRYPGTFHWRVYKKYGNLIFVFGCYWKRDLEMPQKWLITVYPI